MNIEPGYENETIANIGLGILGSYGLEYTTKDITEWIVRFNSDLFDDSCKQLEFIDSVKDFLDTYGEEFMDEYDKEIGVK